MKDHGSAWTLLGAALFSLESLDRIFNVLNVKNMANITHFHLLAIPPPSPRLIEYSKMPAWLGLSALAPSYPYLPALSHSYPLLPTLTYSYLLLPAVTCSYPLYLLRAKLIFSEMF